jgi:hypothetical protein
VKGVSLRQGGLIVGFSVGFVVSNCRVSLGFGKKPNILKVYIVDEITRRLELLKLEGLGFSQAEIVSELSQKAGCSKRTVYLDFERRANWQPFL